MTQTEDLTTVHAATIGRSSVVHAASVTADLTKLVTYCGAEARGDVSRELTPVVAEPTCARCLRAW